MTLSEKQKAAEKWAISQCKKICDWDYVNCYHRANEKEGKHSCDEYTLQRTAFLVGVAWQKRNTKIVSCWKCDTILTITNGKRDKHPQKKVSK